MYNHFLFVKTYCMIKYFKMFFSRTFDYKGRTSRKEFWLGILPNAIIMLFLGALLLYSLFGFSKTIQPFSVTMIILFSLFCLIEMI